MAQIGNGVKILCYFLYF